MAQQVVVIDARGAFCPGPLMELIKKSKHTTSGEVVELWSNDKGSLKDVPQWAEKMGHTFLGSEEVNDPTGTYWRIRVQMK